jgi:hypothetical protein
VPVCEKPALDEVRPPCREVGMLVQAALKRQHPRKCGTPHHRRLSRTNLLAAARRRSIMKCPPPAPCVAFRIHSTCRLHVRGFCPSAARGLSKCTPTADMQRSTKHDQISSHPWLVGGMPSELHNRGTPLPCLRASRMCLSHDKGDKHQKSMLSLTKPLPNMCQLCFNIEEGDKHQKSMGHWPSECHACATGCHPGREEVD